MEQPEKSLMQSFDDLRHDLKSFIETRYEILRAELSSALKKAQGAAMLLAAAAIFASVGLILLGTCVALAIAYGFGALPSQSGLIWGFLITGGCSVLLAAIFGAAGKATLKTADLVPERTLRVLRRDQETLQQGGQYGEPERTRRRA